MVVAKVRRMLERLPEHEPSIGRYALAELVGDFKFLGVPSSVPLDAMKCDLISPSGGVDPFRYVDVDSRALAKDPQRLFPSLRPGMCVAKRVPAREMD